MQVQINEAYELFENKVYGVIKVSIKCVTGVFYEINKISKENY